MEKRAILAILLTAVWLILWQAVLAPPPPRKAPGSVGRPATGATAGRTTSPSLGESQALTPPALPGTSAEQTPSVPAEAQKAEEPVPVPAGETVTVDTPLYHAELDSRGAVITRFELLGYRATCAGGENLDLVEAAKPSERPLEVDLWLGGGGKKAEQLPTREVLFQASATALRLEKGDVPREITFTGEVPGVGKVRKDVRFQADGYSILMNVSVEPAGEEQRLLGIIVPLYLGKTPGIQDRYHMRSVIVMGGRKPTDLRREPIDRILEGKVDPAKSALEGGVRWAGFDERYFLRAVIAPEGRLFGFQEGKFDATTTVVQGILRAADSSKEYTVGLYLGPKKLDDLERTEKSLAKAVDFGMFGDVLPRCFLWMLKGFYRIVGNYGVGIIILTVIVRAAMFPLTLKSLKSMKQMQKVQPEFQALREKYKDSPEKLNQEIMNLYRRYKINPLSGCLPMVLQLPVFLGLYYSLLTAVELRCAPFCLWIQDLSVPDRLGTLSLPFVSPAGIPVLTILMGGTMFLQQKLTPVAGDPNQAKMLQWMPVIFTFMFLSFPSGLTIYWLFSNLVSIAQQLVINRMADRKV